MKDLLNKLSALANSEHNCGNQLHPPASNIGAKMATAATPLLTLLLVVQPAEAWEKSVAFQNTEASTPRLNINSQITHKIEPGDTLWELSQQYHLAAEAIAAYNGIALETTLQVGETLQIPDSQPQETPQLVALSGGGLGGVTSRDGSPLAVESARGDSVTVAAPHLLAQKFPTSRLASYQAQTPVQEFLADVKELQTQYQQKYLDNQNAEALTFSPEEESLGASPWDGSNPPSDRDSLASAPIKIEFYNRFLNPPLGETVNPKLPPLSPPEQYLPEPGQQFNGYIWPAKGIFTSGYGWRWGRMHRGVDIAGPIGTPILAAAPGEVVFAGWNSGGYGKLVKLKHPDESITFYAHNNRILVQKGQEVDQGEQIAAMGNTGRSTGPHLHFEIRPRGKGAVDPLAHLPSGNQVRKGQKITQEKINQ